MAAAVRRVPGSRGLCVIVVALVVAGATPSYALGPLHEAAATGDADVVKAWIARKRNLDVTYDEQSTGLEGNYSRARGLTALMLAARTGHVEIVTLLVEAGANLYAESRWRDGSNPRSAFDYAVASGRTAIAQYLWAKSDGIRLASRLDKHIAERCRESCNDAAGGDARSNLALFLIGIARDDAVLGKGISEAACYAQRPLEILAFLDKHAVRFPRNTLHCVAYHSMVRHLRSPQERIAIASFLLDRGADPNDLPHTPLRGAAAAHDLEMVTLLLARGGDPNLRNADGVTAIGAAANSCVYGATAAQLAPQQNAQLAVIERLAQAGAVAKGNATERSRLQVLTTCCRRQPHTETQRRICEVFGL